MNPTGEFGSPGGRATSSCYLGGKWGMRINTIQAARMLGAAQHRPVGNIQGKKPPEGSVAPTLPVTVPRALPPAPATSRDGGLGPGDGPAAPAAPLLLSARKYPGIKRNRGMVLKEQVRRKFKAPLLIITV